MELNKIYQGDCLEIMKDIPDKSIDMILCDLPYGTTACKWDTIIPFEPLWEQYKRIIKDNGAIVLTASQPFTSALVMSNPSMFKYALVWDKIRKTGHLNAKKQPMRRTEDVLIFCGGQSKYFPQMVTGKPHIRGPFGKRTKGATEVYGKFSDDDRTYESDEYYPDNILSFCAEMKSVHPTQKPVSLFEYLIKTYTNEGDLVLDNCAGSGTTGVAAQNLKRNFILIEKKPEYVAVAENRLKQYPLL